MKSDMRIILTKRLLREGFLKCLEKKNLEKITISDLCKESGINRTTFYNHYQSPIQILRDMAQEYSENLRKIIEENLAESNEINETAIEKCCEYLYENRKELRILFTENADHHLKGLSTEIMSEIIERKEILPKTKGLDSDTYSLYIRASGAASYEMIRCWLTEDIAKSPNEIVTLLKNFLPSRLISKYDRGII